ncbi:hypothetical protein PAPYR_229 [Paratrimastix pyriformis]|uniref:Uncharacterized protein n=1 Tax=Paratrimastix pyriformis TaxID=342808 RepID=A0ABQ8UX01_9EUKA|nr:hypothetical protein PAPYR_229 [Paratrimastix pyriformis]
MDTAAAASELSPETQHAETATQPPGLSLREQAEARRARLLQGGEMRMRKIILRGKEDKNPPPIVNPADMAPTSPSIATPLEVPTLLPKFRVTMQPFLLALFLALLRFFSVRFTGVNIVPLWSTSIWFFGFLILFRKLKDLKRHFFRRKDTTQADAKADLASFLGNLQATATLACDSLVFFGVFVGFVYLLPTGFAAVTRLVAARRG